MKKLYMSVSKAFNNHFIEFSDHFDPRQYLGDAREYVKDIVKHKIIEVLGCNNKI